MGVLVSALGVCQYYDPSLLMSVRWMVGVGIVIVEMMVASAVVAVVIQEVWT